MGTVGTAITFIRAYIWRHLRYGTDALKAISGALNTLMTEGTYHIWGVPSSVGTSSLDERDLGDSGFVASCAMSEPPGDKIQRVVALSWVHHYGNGARRHKMFPSWSPMRWTTDNTERHIVFNGLSDIQTVLARTEQGTKDLPSLIAELSMGSPDVPRYLQLEVETAKLEVHQTRLNVKVGQYRTRRPALVSNYLVALRLDETSYGVAAPRWDIDSRELGDTPILKAAALQIVTKMQFEIKDTSMLLLRDHGSHYERVGYITMEDEDFERRFMGIDATDSRWDILSKLDDADSYLEPKDWWCRHFKKETVIIG